MIIKFIGTSRYSYDCGVDPCLDSGQVNEQSSESSQVNWDWKHIIIICQDGFTLGGFKSF